LSIFDRASSSKLRAIASIPVARSSTSIAAQLDFARTFIDIDELVIDFPHVVIDNDDYAARFGSYETRWRL
jgi:hypothetical protein